MRVGLGMALAAAALLTTVAPLSAAGGRCDDSDNPMATSEGFGIARCAAHGRRYHIDDFAGERVHGYARHASNDDPMVWSDDQWRTDLMSYSDVSDDRYDRRFHHMAKPLRVVRRVIHLFVTPIEATIRTAIRGEEKSFNLRTLIRDSRSSSAGGIGHSCPNGVLVLRWTGYREKAECVTSGRARRGAPIGVNVFRGRA